MPNRLRLLLLPEWQQEVLSPETAKACAGNGRCGEEGRQPPRSWGPDSWLWDLRRLQKARVVSGNEWPASDRHAVSCGITNRPGTFPRSPREPIPAYCYKSWDSRRLLASLELALALKKKKKNRHLPFFFFFLMASSGPQEQTLLLGLCSAPLFSSRGIRLHRH